MHSLADILIGRLPLFGQSTNNAVVYMRSAMGRPGADHDLGKKQFVRVYNLHESRPSLRPLFFSERLAKAAHELAGMTGGIRHYQNQAFFKEQADGATLYHADNLACPLDTRNQYVGRFKYYASHATARCLCSVADLN